MSRIIVKSILVINLILILTCSISIDSFAEEGMEIEENIDNEWVEIPFEGRGIKIVNKYGAELVVIDEFGGIYLNGDIYVNYEKYDKKMNEAVDQSGFNFIVIYVMLALLCMLYGVMLFKDKH